MNSEAEWKTYTLNELSISGITNGIFKNRSSFGRGNPLINVMDTYRSLRVDVDKLEMLDVSESEIHRFSALPGDLFFVSSSLKKEGIGNCCVLLHAPDRCVFECHLMRLRPNRDIVDSEFLALATTSQRFRANIIAASGTTTMTTLSQDQLGSVLVKLPPLPEQRKIADILSTWDEALTRLDALIASKERRKKALMQQLLSGKRRVGGAKGTWKIVTLGEMLDPITRTVSKPSVKFLAAGIRSHGKGVFLKPDFRPEGIALDELFELRTGDLVVNITFAWEGAAAIVPEEANGALVSHRFPTFLFKGAKASRPFFRHYIRSKRFIFDCGLASPGGAGRNRVLSKKAFLDIALKVPDFKEQEQIGAILDTADQQLNLLRTQRTALEQQKRGLMQRLLTGKIRVQPH